MFRNPKGHYFKRISEGVAVFNGMVLERCRVENPQQNKSEYIYFEPGPKFSPLTGYRVVDIDVVTHICKTRLGKVDDFNIHNMNSLIGLEYDLIPYLKDPSMLPVKHHSKCHVVSRLEDTENGLNLNMLIVEWKNYFEITWPVSKIVSMRDKVVSNPNLAIDVSDDIEIESYYPELCSTEEQRNAVIKIVLDFMYQDKFKKTILDAYESNKTKPFGKKAITDTMLTAVEDLARVNRNIRVACLDIAREHNDPEYKELVEIRRQMHEKHARINK